MNNYIVFYSEDGSDVGVSLSKQTWDGTIEYSDDGITWTEYSAGYTLIDKKVYLRGRGNTIITGSSASKGFTLTGTNIKCDGNCESLLDYEKVHPTMGKYCFYRLFYNCDNLVSGPELLGTKLADYCYSSMFQNCEALIKGPTKLTATMLYTYCYENMFRSCHNLTTAPSLPTAVTCYAYAMYGMFAYCTSLVAIPALPKYIGSNYGCYEMFRNCSSIKLSKTQDDEYMQEYTTPSYPSSYSDVLTFIFTGTGGTYTGETSSFAPLANTTYYLHKDCTIV